MTPVEAILVPLVVLVAALIFALVVSLISPTLSAATHGITSVICAAWIAAEATVIWIAHKNKSLFGRHYVVAVGRKHRC